MSGFGINSTANIDIVINVKSATATAANAINTVKTALAGLSKQTISTADATAKSAQTVARGYKKAYSEAVKALGAIDLKAAGMLDKNGKMAISARSRLVGQLATISRTGLAAEQRTLDQAFSKSNATIMADINKKTGIVAAGQVKQTAVVAAGQVRQVAAVSAGVVAQAAAIAAGAPAVAAATKASVVTSSQAAKEAQAAAWIAGFAADRAYNDKMIQVMKDAQQKRWSTITNQQKSLIGTFSDVQKRTMDSSAASISKGVRMFESNMQTLVQHGLNASRNIGAAWSKASQAPFKSVSDAAAGTLTTLAGISKAASGSLNGFVAATRKPIASQRELALVTQKTVGGIVSGYNTLITASKLGLGTFNDFFNKTGGTYRQYQTMVQATATTVIGSARAQTAAEQRASAAVAAALKKRSDALYAYRNRYREVFDNMNQPIGKAGLGDRIEVAERQMDALFRASYRFQMVGGMLQNVGKKIIGIFSSFLDTFGEFQFNMNRAAGALGFFNDAGVETDLTMKGLQEKILDLSVNLRLLPAADIAKALYFWASTTGEVVTSTADLNTQISALTPIMQAAQMTGTDYEAAIKGVYSVLAQFYHGATSEAAHVTELLFYATQKTAAEFPDLINSFKMLGPIASANNVSFEEMVSVLGQIADLGIRGTMAGRALRQMFIQLVRPTVAAKRALIELFDSAKGRVEDFGGKGYEALIFPEGKFVGVKNYIHYLAESMIGMTQLDKNHKLALMATANEIPVLTALVAAETRKILGFKDAIDKDLTNSDAAHEYFVKNWTILTSSWKGVIGGLQRAWEAVKITVGGVLAETLTPLIDGIQKVIDKIRDWAQSPENSGLIAGLSKMAGFVAALAIVAGTVLTIAGGLFGLGAAAFIVVRAFAPMVGVFTVITGALGALATAVFDNFDYISKRVKEAMGIFNAQLGSGGDAIKGLMDVLAAIAEPTKAAFGLLVRMVADMFVHFANLLKVIGGSEHAINLVKLLATALGTLIAAKTIIGLAGLVGQLTGLSKALQGLRLAMLLSSGHSMLGGARGGIFTSMGLTLRGAREATTAIGSVKVVASSLGNKLMSVAKSVGPLGWLAIVAGAGYALKETNFLRFGDFIDSMTDRFRNLDKEVQESWQSLGDFGQQAQVIAANYATSMRGALAASFDAAPGDTVPDSGLGQEPFYLRFLFGDRTESERAAEIDKLVKETNLAFLAALQQGYVNVQSAFAMWGSDVTIDPTSYWTTMIAALNSSKTTDPAQLDKIRQFAENSISEVLYKSSEGVSWTDIEAGLNLRATQMGLEHGPDIIAGIKRSLSSSIEASYKNAEVEGDSIFIGGLVNQINSMIDIGDIQAALDLATEYDIFSQVDTGAYTASLDEAIHGLMGRFSEANRDVLLDTSTISGASSALSAALDTAMNAIWATAIEEMNLNQTFDEFRVAMEQITTGGLEDAVRIFNETLVPIVANGAGGDSLRGTIESIGKLLVAQVESTPGSLLDVDMSEWATAGADTGGDIAQSYLEAFTNSVAGTDFKDTLKTLLKEKGGSGRKIFDIVQQFFSKTLIKGSTGNWEERGVSSAWANSITPQVNGAIDAVVQSGDLKPAQHLLDRMNDFKLPKGTPQWATDWYTGLKSDLKALINGGDFTFEPPVIDFVSPPVIPEEILNPRLGEDGAAVPHVEIPLRYTIPTQENTAATVSAATEPIDTAMTSVETRVATTFTNVIASATTAGSDVLTAFANGVASVLESSSTSIFESTSSAISIMSSGDMKQNSYMGGRNVGKAWGWGFNAGLRYAIDKTLTFVAEITMGNSPPKAGPLRNIDKGGYNVGSVWGENLGKGARHHVTEQFKNLRREINAESNKSFDFGSSGAEITRNNNRKVEIEVSVKSDGNTRNDRDTQSSIRRGVMDALTLADLEHLVTVS